MKAEISAVDGRLDAGRATPMFRQYQEIKAVHRDSILFFRMGDFYEMFFEDAVEAASVLDIALTSRDRNREDRVPMCGVPAHAADGYIARLVQAGRKVAVCEQVEDPRKAKGLVRREVVRVVTPGLITLDGGMKPECNNFIVSVGPALAGGERGIASLDISTGDFLVTETSSDEETLAEVLRLDPSEILAAEGEKGSSFLAGLEKALARAFMSHRPDEWYRPERAARDLAGHFRIHTLDGLGLSGFTVGTAAAGALLSYVRETQGPSAIHLRHPRPYRLGDYLFLDEATRRNLEITANTLDRGRDGTLTWVLDQTMTPMGGRLLRQWILYPLRDIAAMESRFHAVGTLAGNRPLRDALRAGLRKVSDIERLFGRITLGTAGPRDLLALGTSLSRIPKLREDLLRAKEGSELLDEAFRGLDPCDQVQGLIERSIRADSPVSVRDGGVIRDGFDPGLDELIAIQRDGRSYIAGIEREERERTGIPTLKVGFNRVFGYYIEVTKAHMDKVPESYARKQTLVAAERYVTPDLKEMEVKILTAQERRIGLEQELFDRVISGVAEAGDRIQRTARAVAVLDCLASLAEVADRNGYVRPSISDGGRIVIRQGRHPVVERTIDEGGFVPNDVELDPESARMLIITGPNMAGKSTVLRQTALIVLMAQMGSFVPAESAEIGIVDQIFTRVGATDYLSRGQSTFMVEMTETANILHNATPKSLVILDEIGRGTSTYDGLAIAWAVTEELLSKDGLGVRTLFATHYHELTVLAHQFEAVKNLHMAVREWEDQVVFLRHLVEGPANKSYGIQVAAIAGVPLKVIERAKEILCLVERGELATAPGRSVPAGTKRRKRPFQPSLPLEGADPFGLTERISSLDINNLTPLDALKTLANLRDLVKNAGLEGTAKHSG